MLVRTLGTTAIVLAFWACALPAGTRRGWTFKDAGPGKLIGTLIVRGRHTVEVEVTYSPERYSVVYKNSSNMNYSEQGSLIHPNYNKWVGDLMNGVRSELSKF